MEGMGWILTKVELKQLQQLDMCVCVYVNMYKDVVVGKVTKFRQILYA